MKKLIIILCIIALPKLLMAQTVTQTIKGKVTDQATKGNLLGVHVIQLGSDPIRGTITGIDGTFILENVPVGRQSFEFRILGYESYLVSEILVNSGKEVVLEIQLKEEVSNLNEVVITYKVAKEKAINEMASVSSRQFTVEETQQYAGGLNDPARLVSSFAGVASPSISNNGISVRGNSPSGLLWRIEGVEVPSPNHFADLSIAGAGMLTALSSQVLDNSDFMTGAFPAEYGNATSGVFDMNLRSGNSSEKEHTAQISVLGLDFATEGPFQQGGKATYLLNYRYSTLALISPLLPSDAGIIKYQDLSFKINLPTKRAGKFSLWSIGAYDAIDTEAADSTTWKVDSDREYSKTSMFMFASGLNHKITLSSKAFLNTSLAFTGNGLTFKERFLDDDLQEHLRSNAQKNNYKLSLQSSISSYWGDRHFNQTGFYVNNLTYNLDINHSRKYESAIENIAKEDGGAVLFQFYTQSKIELSPRFVLNAGFHSQYFQLNEDFTVEPRISVNYQLNEKSDLAVAYGLHSKTESLGLYFIKDDLGNEPNKELKLMKSHHWVMSYSNRLTETLKLTIEPYYQYLENVPVAVDSYVSTLNSQDNLFFSESLVSNGTGRNIGVDVTMERYLKKGFYYMLSGSIFDSKYTANDGIERNTRLNKNYVFNVILGKEWQVGRNSNNTFSANFRLNYLDGNRVEAIDEMSSIANQLVDYRETNGELSFTEKEKGTPIASFTLSYRKNKPNYSSVWSLQVLNANQAKEFDGYYFNAENQTLVKDYVGIMIPNLSYRIEF